MFYFAFPACGQIITICCFYICFQTADIALGPIAMTQERKEIFTFTNPISQIQLSFLAKQDAVSHNHLTSFAGLLNQNEIQYGVIRGSDTEYLLQTSQNRVLKQLWENIKTNRGLWMSENIFEALERIRRQNYALIVDSDIARYYISQRPCDVVMVDRAVTGISMGFALQNNTDILDEMNKVVAEVIHRTGVWRRSRRRWWRQECDEDEEDTDDDFADYLQGKCVF